MSEENKKSPEIPGLDDLLGLSSDAKVFDLVAHRNLQHLKAKEELSDQQVSDGFKQLLELRRHRTDAGSGAKYRILSAAAGVMLTIFAGIWLMRYNTESPQFVVENESGSGSVSRVEKLNLSENKLIKAKIENLDLRIRGVSGLKAQSEAHKLYLTLESGFLEASYHPGQDRKTLIIQVGETQFRVVGTRFFIQAMPADLRLIVTEGKVAIETSAQQHEIAAGNMWSLSTNAITNVAEKHILSYVKSFEDVKIQPAEISPNVIDVNPVKNRPKNQAKIFLKLGQVISGTLVTEDDDSVVMRTSQGRVLNIRKSEIEKVERER